MCLSAGYEPVLLSGYTFLSMAVTPLDQLDSLIT